MKKIKLLAPIMAATMLTASGLSLAGCTKNNNNKRDDKKLAQDLTETTISEFKKLGVVPRPSYSLGQIRGYLLNWIIDHGYTPVVDKVGNVWFDIPATAGCENYPKVILQGHMDMEFGYDKEQTTQSESGKGTKPVPDPKKHIIELVEETIDGRRTIHSKDFFTSIGADDGIGICMIFALIENKNLSHGPLRAIFTIDEEVGLIGARDIDASALDSDYLISLDGEGRKGAEDIIVSGCQGFCEYKFSHAFDYQQVTDKNHISIEVKGLTGKHCMNEPEILYDAQKGPMVYANADKLILEVLQAVNTDAKDVQLELFEHKDANGVDITFAPKRLPTVGRVVFTTGKATAEVNQIIEKKWNTWADTYKLDPFNASKDKVTVVAADVNETSANVLSVEDSEFLINYFNGNKDDSAKMSIPVEIWDWDGDTDEEKAQKNFPKMTSNIATFDLKESGTKKNFSISTRGLAATVDGINTLRDMHKNGWINKFGSEGIQAGQDFEPWDAISTQTTQFIDYSEEAFKAIGITPTIERIRGGLEPAYFCVSRPTLKPTVMGPRIDSIHTCNETLYVDSLTNTIQAVVYMLEHMSKFK